MKKICSLFIGLCMFTLVLNHPVRAIDKEAPISISVNGHYIITDTKPLDIEGIKYVPIRFVTVALGAELAWDGETQTITIIDGETHILITLGEEKAVINGEEVSLGSPLPVIDNRTMVPISFIESFMETQVTYNEKTFTVELTKENYTVPATSILERGYTDDDLYLLAKIVTVEAMDLSFDGKVAIANVVINRKKHSEFPSSIHDVIYDKKYGKQFPPAHKQSFATREPSTDSMIAAKVALEGINNISTCLYFNNRPFKSKANDFYQKIDGEYFYK